MTLNPAQGAVPPVSSIIRRVNSPTLEVHDVTGLQQQRAAFAGPGLAPDLERDRRGIDRRLASSTPAAAARVASLPVKGSWRS